MTMATFTPVLAAYRFAEDGTEAGATLIGSLNTPLSRNVTSNSSLQLRVRIQETGGADGATTDDYTLRVSLNGGAFTGVTAINQQVIPNTGSALADGGASTNRLGAGTGSFVAGEQEDQNGIVENHQLTLSNYTEHVWGITLLVAGLADADALTFEVQLNGATITSNVTPTINVNIPPTLTAEAGAYTYTGTAAALSKPPTPVAALNTNAALNVDTTYLLRVRVERGGSVGGTGFRWAYNHNGGGDTPLTTTSTHVKAVAAASYANDDDVREVLGGTGTYFADNNAATEDGTTTLGANFPASGAAEFVLAFQIDSENVANGQTGTIRLELGDGTDLDTYDNTFTYTVVDPYAANSVNFDGTNDYLTRGAALTGIVDGNILLISKWIRVTGGNGTFRRLFSIYQGTTTARFVSSINASNFPRLYGENSSSVQILGATSSIAITDTNWHHILWSINLANAAQRALYIDGVEDTSVSWEVYNTGSALDLNTTTPDVSIGASPTGADKFTGDIAELYFTTPASWYDPSAGSNLAKFISSNVPVDAGDGSIPTGSAPLVLLRGPTVDWHTNVGTGGGFTENGALTDGQTPVELTGGATIAAESGTYSLTGTAATLRWDHRLTADAGAYTLTGTDAGLFKGVGLAAEAAAYTYTGQGAALLWNHRLTAEAGAYTYTGETAGLFWNHLLRAVGAAEEWSDATLWSDGTGWLGYGEPYTLTGQAATLTWNQGAIILTAESGSYTLTGQDATLIGPGETLTAEAGAYTLTGTDAGLRHNHYLAADVGGYILSGTAATLLWNHVLAAEIGSYVLTGQDATLTRRVSLTAEAGSYSLTGTDATLDWQRRLVADPGAYSFTGRVAQLSAAGEGAAASGWNVIVRRRRR